jgi:hypothetical protein
MSLLANSLAAAMCRPQVDRATHEYDLYLTLFITASGGW